MQHADKNFASQIAMQVSTEGSLDWLNYILAIGLSSVWIVGHYSNYCFTRLKHTFAILYLPLTCQSEVQPMQIFCCFEVVVVGHFLAMYRHLCPICVL